MTNPDLRAYWATKPAHAALLRVVDELKAQDARWGEQNHPLIGTTTVRPEVARKSYAALADSQKRLNDYAVENGTLGWDDILLEEVYEALGETDPEKAVTELVQVAAVAIQAAMSLVRNEIRKEAA